MNHYGLYKRTRGKSPLNPWNRHQADQGPIQLRMTKNRTRINVKGSKGRICTNAAIEPSARFNI